MTVQPAGSSGLERPSASSLADVIDTILDKGLVIDAYVRVSLVGIELLTIDARVVIASVDTYLRFAEAVNRLDISEGQQHGLPDLLEDINKGGAKSRTSGALEAAGEKLTGLLGGGESENGREHAERRDRRRER
ncbi:MAG TPA: gas vesicle protein GvpJ [Actinocrinis sp.]|nr:gas vesicle protein GvpJ [Actinocrinis sp.]